MQGRSTVRLKLFYIASTWTYVYNIYLEARWDYIYVLRRI